MTEESHPLLPFLPENARVLFLGSFPPPRHRWCMDFFYPNWINDFWRVMGLLFFADKTYFEQNTGDPLAEARPRCFDQERVMTFAAEQGLAFYDTATRVRRLKDNASDNFLEIVQPTDIMALVAAIPTCRRVVTTGGKASEILQHLLSEAAGQTVHLPAIGESVQIKGLGRECSWWRMPSTSRAYPLALGKKAEYYKRLFPELQWEGRNL